MAHNWDVGMLEGMAGSGRGNFPSPGCVSPVWFRKNQWDGTFLVKGSWNGIGMAPGYPWDVTRMSLPAPRGMVRGSQKNPRNEKLALETPSPTNPSFSAGNIPDFESLTHLKMLENPTSPELPNPTFPPPNTDFSGKEIWFSSGK